MQPSPLRRDRLHMRPRGRGDRPPGCLTFRGAWPAVSGAGHLASWVQTLAAPPAPGSLVLLQKRVASAAAVCGHLGLCVLLLGTLLPACAPAWTWAFPPASPSPSLPETTSCGLPPPWVTL